MSATVTTTIDIDAGPHAVWDVLTDFPAYPEWNPFMASIDGEHSFVLTAEPDGTTRFTHSERFTGTLVALFEGATANSRAGFEAFNEALKRRVETARSGNEDPLAGTAPRTTAPSQSRPPRKKARA